MSRPARSYVATSCAGLSLLLPVLAGCATKTNTTPATIPSAATDEVEEALAPPVVQLSVTREDGTVIQRTGFFVRGYEGRLFAVTCAHALAEGPAVTRVEMLDERGVPLASTTESWGWTGSDGMADPILDLGDDLVVLRVLEEPNVMNIEFSAESASEPGRAVWLPAHDTSQPAGAQHLEGEVLENSLGAVRIQLAQAIDASLLVGTPVLAVEDDSLVGVVSRSFEGSAKETQLLLTPAREVRNRVLVEEPVFPLAAVLGRAGVGEKVQLTFGWPAGESWHVQRRIMRGSLPMGGVGSYRMELSSQGPGLRIRNRASVLEELVANGLRMEASSVAEGLQREIGNGFMGMEPTLVIDAAGVLVQVEDSEAIARQLRDLVSQANPGRPNNHASLITPELLTLSAQLEWQRRVGVWRGRELTLGTVQAADDETSSLLGHVSTSHVHQSATHRTACDESDHARSCVALWLWGSPERADPQQADAGAQSGAQHAEGEALWRVRLVVEPATLILVSTTREKFSRSRGQRSRYEFRGERLKTRSFSQ